MTYHKFPGDGNFSKAVSLPKQPVTRLFLTSLLFDFFKEYS